MAGEQPTLTTARLLLRPLVAADAPDVQRLAGAREVATTVVNIPHPYPDGAAAAFIAAQQQAWAAGSDATWAVVHDGRLVGCVALHFIAPADRRAGLGYWIGPADWNRGFATEAARAVVDWAFAAGWQRVQADHLVGNVASGRVMQKIGMRHEGRLRGYYRGRDGRFVDVEQYARLRDDR